MHRASFEKIFEWMKEKGITDRNQALKLIDRIIELGLAEGNDEVGYILTEKGVNEAEKHIYDSVGVV